MKTIAVVSLLAACGLLLVNGASHAQLRAQRGAEDPNNPCGMIYTDHYGPYDFRTQKRSIKVVEDFHFTAKVESLLGAQSGYIGGDLNYTLRASPNHARALIAVTRWVEKNKADQTRGMDFPVACYYDRAVRFAPDDPVVRALYARFLHQRKRTAEGLKHLDVAVSHAGDNGLSHYNLGLVYLELDESDKALARAHEALRLGFTRPELADLLKKAGRWVEPAAAAASAAGASAAASTAASGAASSPAPVSSAASAAPSR